MDNQIKQINDDWTTIYYHLHYPHEDKITHQVIRILQHIQKQKNVSVNDLAFHLGISQNTASEHVKRLIKKDFLIKKRDPLDERRVFLSLTPLGQEVLHRNTTLDEEKLEHIFQGLKEDEKEIILAAFQLLSGRAKQCMS